MENNSVLRAILDNLHYGVFYIDDNGRIVYINKYAENLSGYKCDELIGKELDFCECNLLALGNAVFSRDAPKLNTFLTKKDSTRIPVVVKASPDFDAHNMLRGMILTMIDNSYKVAMGNKIKNLEKSASYDYLTKIHNRRIIEKEIYSRLEEFERYDKGFGVLMFDIDNFKMINDHYGHNIGDLILKMVSQKFTEALRPFDFLGRWGGEEFIVLLTNVNEAQLFSIANRFRKMIESSTMFLGESIIRVTVSGGATIARQGDNIHSITKRADDLLYKSKDAGRNRVSV